MRTLHLMTRMPEPRVSGTFSCQNIDVGEFVKLTVEFQGFTAHVECHMYDPVISTAARDRALCWLPPDTPLVEMRDGDIAVVFLESRGDVGIWLVEFAAAKES